MKEQANKFKTERSNRSQKKKEFKKEFKQDSWWIRNYQVFHFWIELQV